MTGFEQELIARMVEQTMNAARDRELVEDEWGSIPPHGETLRFADWHDGLGVDSDVVYDGLDTIAKVLTALDIRRMQGDYDCGQF